MVATPSFRVIGIDPGSQVTGYGVVDKNGGTLRHVDNGCIATRRQDPFAERLHRIYESLVETLDTFRPQAFVIEEIFYAKNVASSLKLGECRGIALLAAWQKGVPIFEYSTREVKQAVTGYGQASKGQVQEMVRRLLGLPEVAAEDASDALALAICHLNTSKMKELSAG